VSVTNHGVGCSTSTPQQRQQQQQQQQRQQQQHDMKLLPVSLLSGQQQQQQQMDQQQHQQQLDSRNMCAVSPLALQSAVAQSRAGSSSTGGSTSRSIAGAQQQGELQPDVELQQPQPQRPGPAAAIDTHDPDAAVAAITAAITADIGEPLAGASCRARPQLFIGDLLVGPSGTLLPTAEQQLAVISGLFQQCAGDLLEIYGYYALLGGSAQVVADR
jgi:hypothetical protein